MKKLVFAFIFIVLLSCRYKRSDTESPLTTEVENDTLRYYNPNFVLSPLTALKTDGYYEVKEFDTYDFNERPNYGFIHFSRDGYCRFEWKLHTMNDPKDVHKAFVSRSIATQGLYKIHMDTIKIEFLNTDSWYGGKYFRSELTGILEKDKIIFVEGAGQNYIYPYKHADTLTSRCVGRFVKVEFDSTELNSYFNRNNKVE